MDVELQYGEEGLLVEGLPDERTTVIEPSHLPRAADEARAVREALREPLAGPPLRDLLRRGQTVAISVCDGTRPQPREVVVPAVLDELEGIVRLEDVVVLVATGTHRGNTVGELREMLGDEVMDSVRVVNHDARDQSRLTWVGSVGGDVPVWLNTEWLSADIRITTGFVEPHFFAGFSGGPKMVAPGLAGLETTLVLHDGRRIGHPNARWGITEGNPVHDDVRAIAAATGVTFALDVVLDGRKRIARAFGGELFAMHEAAIESARLAAMRPLPRRFEVVLTSNSGYPLDQNLYQAVKGMSAAAQIVSPGGTIICVAECRDGFPDHGDYRRQLTSGVSPAALLEEIEARTQTVPDQWEIQIQAKIQSMARVVMHTSHLSDSELAQAHLEQTTDIANCVAEALAAGGSESRLCVLPSGPLTIPYIDQSLNKHPDRHDVLL